jgi:hypothetical protein
MDQQQSNQQQHSLFAASGLFQSTTDVWTPFKLSAEGFAGGGKSLTVALIVVGLWIEEGRTKTVCLQDTERSAKFIVPLFKYYGLIEGKNFFVTPSRSLIDFGKILDLCNRERGIFMTDTATHLHEQMLADFSAEKKRPVVYPGDSFVLKPMWKEKFSTPFTEAQNCHLFFTGRAAWEYTMEYNEDTKKKEFNATGVKMRGDNEIAYEPDVVVYMERLQDLSKKSGVTTYRRASILKDRSRLIDGKSFEFWPQGDPDEPVEKSVWDFEPVWSVFRPVYKFLTAGNPVESKKEPPQTSMAPLFSAGNAELYWKRRQQVDVLLEEIDGVYAQWIPGSGALEKQLRSIIWNLVFNTRSKSALAERAPEELKGGFNDVETLSIYVAKNLDELEKMHDKGEYQKLQDFLKAELERMNKPPAPKTKTDDDDQIPEFSAAPKAAASLANLSVKNILEAYQAAKTIDEIEAIDRQVEPLLETMEPTDRDSIVMACDLARSALLVEQPKHGKSRGKAQKGKQTHQSA